MSKKEAVVIMTKKDAELIVHALYELDDEEHYNHADRVNKKLAKAFDEDDDWLAAIRMNGLV